MKKNTITSPLESSLDHNQEMGIINDDIEIAHDFFDRNAQIQREKAHEKEQLELQEKRKQKELVRIERIKAGGGNQIVYALEEIIRRAFLGKGTARASYYDLGFENTTSGLREAVQLLTLLRDDGCIQQFSQLSDDSFKIDGVKNSSLEEMKLKLKEETRIEAKEPRNKNHLESINLVTGSLEPQDVIFLVLDRRYEMPIRCSVSNHQGKPTYIKKFYNIAYIADAPGKKVAYDKYLADCINNGLFGRKSIKKYMQTNKLKKPTLVQKSEEGNILVLRNDIPVQTILIKNIPSQYQSLYIDKTK